MGTFKQEELYTVDPVTYFVTCWGRYEIGNRLLLQISRKNTLISKYSIVRLIKSKSKNVCTVGCGSKTKLSQNDVSTKLVSVKVKVILEGRCM